MTKDAHGFLLVLTQPSGAMEDEFNAWYDLEHLPDRMTVPGFLTGLRFVAVDGGHPKYLAYYDIEQPEVLESDAYNAISGANFSPWTRRVTSRVIVDRRAGSQVWPGDGTLSLAPRLRMLRLEGSKDEAGEISEAMRACVEASPGALSMVFVQSETPTCYYGFIRMTYAESDAAFFPRLGNWQCRVSQHTVYAPYDGRVTPPA